ncbi:hypothetical protein GCM10028772_01750 [Nocardioides ultimimeridianus]
MGARVLGNDGYLVVTALGRHTVTVETSNGESRDIGYGAIVASEMANGQVAAVGRSLEPWWSGLPAPVHDAALFKLEVVLEVLTGYRLGHSRLALPGEPYVPFGDSGMSETRRCARMAELLCFENSVDRTVVRRITDGEPGAGSVGANTVQEWIRRWRRDGLRGLVDGRSVKQPAGFEALDVRVRAIVDEIFRRFDGDVSRMNLTAIEAELRVQMKAQGIGDVAVPQRLMQEYLSERQRALGRTTRSHRSRRVRRAASAHTSYAAMHPGHLVMDATRADVRVWDEVHECPRNVEVLTIMSVATRVVVALRLTPQSGNALEAGLALYDALRPMSMLVEGTTIDDWRWGGVPETLDLSEVSIHRSRKRVIPPGASLSALNDVQGEHVKPGVTPSSLRCDHGSVFISEQFTALLRDFGIDLMLSRGSKPSDNPHVERYHETLQRAYQSVPGYKGRNVSERGRRVDDSGEKLLTAAELERHLRRFIALDYHRERHDGLTLPGRPDIRLTPLEMWDAMLQVTGRLHVPQHPDLIYQFLPIRWLTIGHAGVEYKNLIYDAEVLKEFRDVRRGTFRAKDRAAPFHYDPRDMTRIWFRHPQTGRVHEIAWKAKHLYDLPLWESMVDRADALIVGRGGNRALKPRAAEHQLIEVFGRLHEVKTPTERRQDYASRLRWDQAQRDHDEAAEAAALMDGEGDTSTLTRPDLRVVPDVDDEIWPDYDNPDQAVW